MKITRNKTKLWLADQAFIALLIMLAITAGAVIVKAPPAVSLIALALSALSGFAMWLEWRNSA